MSAIEPFELFAVRYGTNSGRLECQNVLGGAPDKMGSDLSYYVWVARRSDAVFVIDTGMDQATADARKRTLLRRPADALALLGIEAKAIDHVIITHLHFDHAGTLSDFPRARFHVQDGEVSFATGRCMCHEPLRHAYDVEHVVSFVRCVYAGRVAFHEGAEEIVPGLTVHRTGGHAKGLQVVRVLTKRGHVVVASDASHLYQNMEGRLAFPVVHSIEDLMEGYETLYRLASSPDHVIPGHDPLVMSLYPPPAPELEGIVARLDVPPRARG